MKRENIHVVWDEALSWESSLDRLIHKSNKLMPESLRNASYSLPTVNKLISKSNEVENGA